MLRGDAQTAVQSEIRCILESVCEEQYSWCLHDNDIQGTKSTNMFDIDCNLKNQVPIPIDFDEIFAPSCQTCGWVETSCFCSRSLKPPSVSNISEHFDAHYEDVERIDVPPSLEAKYAL